MRKLNRYSEHRIMMLRNLSISLIEHGKIVTTIARAKALREFIEPLITRSKTEDLSTRRLLLSRLNNNNKTINKLFKIGNMNKSRPGGYIRIIHYGYRSDIGLKSFVQIVDYPSGAKDDQGDR